MIRRIDLSNDPYQSFIITINDIELKLVLAWNGINQFWAFDIYNNNSGDLLLGGGAIRPGLNLFELVPPYTLGAWFFTRQGLLNDPKRNELELGYLYTGDGDAI